MTLEVAVLPLEARLITVTVATLEKVAAPGGSLLYLQSLRRSPAPSPDSGIATTYRAMRPLYAARLAQMVPTDAEIVLSPPSRFPEEVEPYRHAIMRRCCGLRDFTTRLSRSTLRRASDGASVLEIMNGLAYEPLGSESQIRSLLIVDDILNRGTTATALILLLRQHGLPEDCSITVAAPLWIVP